MVSSHRLLDLLGVELPIIQAPMAGATSPQMVIAVSNAGGLGSLPSSLYSEAELRAALDTVRAGTSRPINVNFLSHETPPEDAARQAAWRQALAPYYAEAGLDPDQPIAAGRAPRRAADVWLVRYDPRVQQVSIRRGENGGKTLPHRDIVRQLTRLGGWNGAATSFAPPASPDPAYRTAVLVQEPDGGPILAAARLD